MRLGYACINLSVHGTFRNCVLRSLERYGIPFVKEIVKYNFSRLYAILEWNEKYNMKLYRLSSELVPFGSHLLLRDWSWWEDPDLIAVSSKCKDIVKRSGMRITIHPGQFNNLNSPVPKVVESTYKDLEYQTRLLEFFSGTDMILHVGGRYEGKDNAISRFKDRYKDLPSKVKKYLRIENDDKVFNISDVLNLCYDLSCKPMYDYHHDRCLPSIGVEEVRSSLKDLWGNTRIKVHLSSGISGVRDRSHADYISASTWESFSNDFGDLDLDIMLETKKKELSVFRVRGYGEAGIGVRAD